MWYRAEFTWGNQRVDLRLPADDITEIVPLVHRTWPGVAVYVTSMREGWKERNWGDKLKLSGRIRPL